jgi:hypothetical protein
VVNVSLFFGNRAYVSFQKWLVAPEWYSKGEIPAFSQGSRKVPGPSFGLFCSNLCIARSGFGLN